MRRPIAAVLGLALVGSLWLPWVFGHTGWEWFTYSDVVVCLAAAAAIALPATWASVLSVAALIGVAATPARSPFDEVGMYVGLSCGVLLVVSCLALVGRSRLGSRDWSADVAAGAVLVTMYMPWTGGWDGEMAYQWMMFDTHLIAFELFRYADHLMLLGVAASLAAVHARLPTWVAPLACAVALIAVGVEMVAVVPEEHTAYGLRYGAWAGPGCLLILLATTVSIARAERRWGTHG